MRRAWWALCALWLVFSVSLPGCPQTTPDEHVHGAEDTLYTCPMHPQILRSEPGSCPICGMDLVPVGDAPAASADQVVIDPGMVQTIGVRTEPVRRQTVFKHLRTLGEVDVAEDEVSVVNLRFSGWVETLRVERTGDPVKKGDRLLDIYSPELVSAQEELLLALRSGGADSPLARSARRRLELWDIAASDIDAVVKAGTAQRTLPIRAPTTGFVLAKNVVAGARVMAGTDLYRIGNLKRIWVNAEVYEFDAPWVEEGQPAQMELSFQKGKVVEGRVAYIYPTLNEKSRTLRVRLEFENPGVALKPGMFATVYIQFRRQEDTLAVPTEAILHTGQRELVFVALGGGRFEPREITTGMEADHHLTEVLTGLKDGEEVVVSGQFLIDSESQLQEAIEKVRSRRAGDEPAAAVDDTLWSCPMHPGVISETPGRCPECGMFLEKRTGTPEELARLHDHDHGPDLSAVDLDGDGRIYTCPMHPEVVQDTPGRCPKCNMFLESRPTGAE